MNMVRRGSAMVMGVLMGACVFAGPVMAGPLAGPASSSPGDADAVFYEVTEAVQAVGVTKTFRSSTAVLSGTARPGTPLCPGWLGTAGIDGCWVIIRAVGKADDATGIGDVTGAFEVMIQDLNLVDAPEVVIMRGKLAGRIDLSPAFLANLPLGTITGTFYGSGLANSVLAHQQASGGFTGTFRMPFTSRGRASYLLDNGKTTAVRPYEFSIGYPAVKLEVTFSESGPLGKLLGRYRD